MAVLHHGGRGDGQSALMTPDQASSEDLIFKARQWANVALDSIDANEVERLLASALEKDPHALAELGQMFKGRLAFGTAGLRAQMGAGESQMNTSVIAQASWGFGSWLKERNMNSVVIGFDARINSERFAQVAAEVFGALGLSVRLSAEPVATPVLSFAIRHLRADAGVMITASHNPRHDNGYKVYLGDGCQIAPPVDSQIADLIALAPPPNQIPLTQAGKEFWSTDVITAYVARAKQLIGSAKGDFRWVYTPMHGVGKKFLLLAISGSGLPKPELVASQSEPDGSFPRLPYPNPEEPGALTDAIATADAIDAHLIVANDPDADRCAVAVKSKDQWHQLTGDQVGALLAWWLARDRRSGGVFASTLVSSVLTAAIAERNGYRHQTTLTGFKWIGRIPDLIFGYEEALGYCADPSYVKDKDGITAAIELLKLQSYLEAQGKDLLHQLDEIYLVYGLHYTETRSTRLPSATDSNAAIDQLIESPPAMIDGFTVTDFQDLSQGVDGLPPTNGVRLFLDERIRVILRPSGTEAKLKTYLEIITQSDPSSLERDKLAAKATAERVHDALRDLVLCLTP